MPNTGSSNPNIMTIERHFLSEQKTHPEATGVLTNILYDLALSGKLISNKTSHAGLFEILGRTSKVNIQGERVMKIDQIADQTIRRLNEHTGRIAVMASEEHEDILPIDEADFPGKYVLLFDPLDGSSNIDYNASIGTIFSIYKRKTDSGSGTLEDCLQPGRDLVAAGYMMYGTSTMLIYSTGSGAHGFTLDHSLGEFLLSHPNIKTPAEPTYYSTNHGYQQYWSEGVLRFVRYLQGIDGNHKPLSSRYIGALVSDFHRNLLAGGVFFYPADSRSPQHPHGKLRLLYEAAPLAFIAEQAGGYASDGTQNILDIQPATLHQRSPLFIGNRELVEKAEEFIGKYD